ncbi:MAG: zinc-ribbon domain-containing protein [Promethearchaeota archaeon]
MAWVPIVVPNKHNRSYRNKAGGGIFAVVILLFIFGLLFFVFFNRFDGFSPPIFMMISGFGVFLIIILVISVIAASMSQVYKKPKYEYETQKQNLQRNPYKIQNSIIRQPEYQINNQIKQDIPVIQEINYCRYCGSKIDRDAVFCHMCGTKL